MKVVGEGVMNMNWERHFDDVWGITTNTFGNFPVVIDKRRSHIADIKSIALILSDAIIFPDEFVSMTITAIDGEKKGVYKVGAKLSAEALVALTYWLRLNGKEVDSIALVGDNGLEIKIDGISHYDDTLRVFIDDSYKAFIEDIISIDDMRLHNIYVCRIIEFDESSLVDREEIVYLAIKNTFEEIEYTVVKAGDKAIGISDAFEAVCIVDGTRLMVMYPKDAGKSIVRNLIANIRKACEVHGEYSDIKVSTEICML